MSAWIVDKAHIDLLVTAGLELDRRRDMRWNRNATMAQWEPRELSHTTATEVGRMLWAENVTSVKGLYPDEDETTLPGPGNMTPTSVSRYRFAAVPGPIDPVTVLKALASYEYQSCEHDGWDTSEAQRFCDALRSVAINALPGYAAAPWSFDDRNYFRKTASAR